MRAKPPYDETGAALIFKPTYIGYQTDSRPARTCIRNDTILQNYQDRHDDLTVNVTRAFDRHHGSCDMESIVFQHGSRCGGPGCFEEDDPVSKALPEVC